MNYELILWLTGIMLLTYWLNYCMGRPNVENIDRADPGAILFWIPMALADRRLRQSNLRKAIDDELEEMLAVTPGLRQQMGLYREWRRARLDVGREFFSWERSITCPICLHWWLTVIFGIVCLSFNLLHARQDLLLAGFTYLLNHFFIRKIS